MFLIQCHKFKSVNRSQQSRQLDHRNLGYQKTVKTWTKWFLEKAKGIYSKAHYQKITLPEDNKLEKLNVQAGKTDKILLAHVQRICEAHDTVMRSYYQQIHGSSGAATTSMEIIGEQVYV